MDLAKFGSGCEICGSSHERIFAWSVLRNALALLAGLFRALALLFLSHDVVVCKWERKNYVVYNLCKILVCVCIVLRSEETHGCPTALERSL